MISITVVTKKRQDYFGICSSSVFVSGNAIASVGRLPFSFIDRWYLTNVVRSYAIHLPHKITPFREKHKQKKFRKFNSKFQFFGKLTILADHFITIFMTDLKAITSHFAISGEVAEIKPLGSGLINDTFLVTTRYPDTPDYVLQRIKQAIFTDVPLLQENIRYITSRIRYHLQQRNANDIDRKTLTLVPATDERLYYYDGNSYWRLTIYIAGSKTFEQVTPDLAYQTGRAFGEFQYFLSDIPNPPIGATIPDFHNMEFRLGQFREAIARDKAARLAKVQPIVDELLGRSEEMCRAERLHREGKLPKRITHCDTKVNNMLFDQDDRFLCVIDLDTTMPGFVLSDFGDFIRTAANKGAEDDKELDRVGLDMEIFREFARGYLETASAFLTPIEKQLLPYGAQLLTYMQTVRFLTDYLNGDTYYKIQYPEHNLQRTLAQLTHLHSIDSHLEEMNAWINQLSNQ